VQFLKNESDFDSVAKFHSDGFSSEKDSNEYLELKFIKRIIIVIHSGIRLPYSRADVLIHNVESAH